MLNVVVAIYGPVAVKAITRTDLIGIRNPPVWLVAFHILHMLKLM
jgi:hypothetical protein